MNLKTGANSEGVHESTVHWLEISSAVVDAVIASGSTMGSVRAAMYGFMGNAETFA